MSVRKRLLHDGEVRWQVDYRDGAGIRRHCQFATKREAEVFYARARTEVAAGVHTPRFYPPSRSPRQPSCGSPAASATNSRSRRCSITGST